MTRAVLMLELNELSPVLMDRFIAEGHLPGFRRLRDRSATFITEAGEDGERLNPWVQWVTVHTGATAAEHGIKKLGESHKLNLPTIADAVSAAGGTVWLCGSMNVRPTGSVTGAVLPDPWSVDGNPQPPELQPFFRFVSANVQEHTSETTPLSKRDAIAFVRFWVTHGGSPRTALEAARQLVGERTHRVGRWQRAELLDRFQWDVFTHYYRRTRPTFATFFSNSTAHFQHLHWSDLERDARSSAVLHGYVQMDRIVDKAMALAGDDAVVILCTALSQTANDDDLAYEGFYRPRRLDALADDLGLVGVDGAAPMMAEQSHLYFGTAEDAETAVAALESVLVGGEPVFDVRRTDNDLVVGVRLFTRQPASTTFETSDGRRRPVDDLFYWSDSPREGTHHPDGILWIGDGGDPRRDTERVPLTAVAPTILSMLDIDRPESMKGALVASRGD